MDYYEFDLAGAARFADDFVGGALSSSEVGDGNLNRVFRVGGKRGSVVVKQALPYLKVAGADWPLTRRRAWIERSALEAHGEMVPDLLPDVIHFDDDLSALVLEDLHAHENWRDLLIAGRETPGIAAQVGRYSAAVLLGTGHLATGQRRTAMRRTFGYSDLCLLTETLVFTAPFTAAESNRVEDALAPTVAALASDSALRAAAAQLRYVFRTRNEALIHGDLHSGSVLVGADGARIIDLEFAFFGPMGFDIGLLIGNLALSSIAHASNGNERYARVVAGYAAEFWNAFVDESARIWRPGEPWFHPFIAGVIADAARFAGLEMIRRTVGLAHVRDIDSLPEAPRLAAQLQSVDGGRSLVLGPTCTTFAELWARATRNDHLI
ncbi:S-methyl-5-thioribose kinase [Pseudolysinimonas kribbensis]